MAELVPTPFSHLLRRVMLEQAHQGTIFDLSDKRWFAPGGLDDAARARATDLPASLTSVRFHGQPARTPLGPAAGPHDQMAQNLVLAYLGGSRIFELKTVQIDDQLTIGRPCIEAGTVGWNIEFSQELRLEQSLEEYVKGAMLVHVLQREGVCGGAPEDDPLIWDISVGYDLAGVQSDPVRRFLEGMMDASAVVEKLRGEIPDEFARLRDLDFPTRLSRSVTLSTFHGCPPDEIEKIVDHLIREYGLHVTIKMNPTMLGRDVLLGLLHDAMGYTHIQPRESAFTSGLMFDDSIEMCRRLHATARARGVGLGAKFTNTMETVNDVGYMPDETMYMSGKPLHVLSVELMARFREAYGAPIETTFSAGLDKTNCAATLATGTAPATTCTDLLKPGGYGRLHDYLRETGKAFETAGVDSLDAWIYAAHGAGAEAVRESLDSPETREIAEDVRAQLAAVPDSDNPAKAFADLYARVENPANPTSDFDRLLVRAKHAIHTRNNRLYADAVKDDERYGLAKNNKPPKKIDSHLETFDCISCDKCIPVCPNDANYVYMVEEEEAFETTIWTLADDEENYELTSRPGRPFAVARGHQLANFADWCNECGNCDTFCPEYDGPYIKKPSFYGSREAWEAMPEHDGFHATIDDEEGCHEIVGRMEGRVYSLRLIPDINGYGWDTDEIGVLLDEDFNVAEVEGVLRQGDIEIDLWPFHVMRKLLEGVLSNERLTPANAPFWDAD